MVRFAITNAGRHVDVENGSNPEEFGGDRQEGFMDRSVDQILDCVRENVDVHVQNGVLVAKSADARSLSLPAIYPEWLGDAAFAQAHGARFNYVVGEMARGIATPRMVIEAVRAGIKKT